MKKLVMGFFVLLIYGCKQDTLSKKVAIKVLQQEKPFPDTLSFAVFTRDPTFAMHMLQNHLEEKGLIIVSRSKNAFDKTAWICLTKDGERHLLTASENDRKTGVQRVRTGTRDLGEIIQVQIKNSGNNAIVSYTVVYRDLSPFSILINKKEGQVDTVKSYMQKVGADWHIDKKPDIEYLMP